jgi:allantoinase
MARWDQAWGGISSLGLALPVMWTVLERRGLNLSAGMERIGSWMGAKTAQLAGLSGRKGALVPGADADFAVFDPDAVWTVAPEHLRFRHKLSPYLGSKLHGRVFQTWLRGEQIFSGDSFVGEPRGKEQVRR